MYLKVSLSSSVDFSRISITDIWKQTCKTESFGQMECLFMQNFRRVSLKVLSNGTGGGMWVVSIDRPLIRQHFRRFKKII